MVGGELGEKPAYSFSNLEAEDERSVAIACEVWLGEICAAPWASRECMKIAALLTRHIMQAATSELRLRDLEGRHNMIKGEILLGLNLIKIFGFLDGYFVEGDKLMVSPKISHLQLINVLETSRRYQQLLPASESDKRADAGAFAAAAEPAPADPASLARIAAALGKDDDGEHEPLAYSI